MNTLPAAPDAKPWGDYQLEFWTCPKCGETKQLDLFPVDLRRPSGRQTPCRQCQYQAQQRWRRRVGYNRLRRNARSAWKRSMAHLLEHQRSAPSH